MGGVIRWLRSGTTPALVLIGGWAMPATLLADAVGPTDRAVGVVDLPGHDRPDGVIEPAELASAAGAELSAPAFWVGWSLGAQVALEAALGDAARCSGVVLIAMSPRFIDDGDWRGVSPAELRALGVAARRDPAAAVRGFRRRLCARGVEARALKQQLANAATPGDQALSSGLACLRDADYRWVLDGLAVPSLWLGGALDPLIPPESLEWAANRAPGGHCRIVSDAGHAPFLARPGCFGDAIDTLTQRAA